MTDQQLQHLHDRMRFLSEGMNKPTVIVMMTGLPALALAPNLSVIDDDLVANLETALKELAKDPP